MKKKKLDTPRKGNWSEVCNQPIPFKPISEFPAILQNEERRRRFKLMYSQVEEPEVMKRNWELFKQSYCYN